MWPFSEAEGEEQVPVAFRYDVKPFRSMRTNVFRPNVAQGEARFATLGWEDGAAPRGE